MGTRWTPVAAVLAVVSLLLLGAGVVAAVTHEGDDHPVTESMVDQEVSSTTVAATTTSTAAATTTTAPPTTVARTTTTRGTTTTVRRTTSTRVTTTTTPAPDQPLCAASQIDVSVATDAPSYLATQAVRQTTTIRNKSTSPCFYQGYTVTMNFLDPAQVAFLGTSVHLDDPAPTEFRPGQSLTQSFTWDPRSCQSPPVCVAPTAGTYSVQAAWIFSGGNYADTQPFNLT